MSKPKIILNQIETPDGTILRSFHRHDYKTHRDKNGKVYMVDGGSAYLRRNFHPDAPYEEMTIYDDAPFEIIREHLHWGTRGPEGDQPLTWKPLMDLDTDHIQAIIEDGYKSVEKYMKLELEYRFEKGI